MHEITVSNPGPVTYLKKELNFNISEWKALTEQDKKDLQKWAVEEMEMKK